MKKNGIMNSEIAAVVAAMGHTDQVAIVDAGFPIPATTRRIDTAIKPGLPSFLEVLENITSELTVEGFIISQELAERNLDLCERIGRLFPGAVCKIVPHEQLKQMTQNCKAVVRTGECTPFANVILCSGVTF